MIPVNFPNPPEGCTHKVLCVDDGGLMFFYNETTGKLFDTQFGLWLDGRYDNIEDLEGIGDFVLPLTLELENK